MKPPNYWSKAMTKELSKQLCELCGIKGKRVKYETETTDGCINLGSRLEFPDFGKPENFVKLEEIMLAELAKHHLTVVKWVHYWSDNTLMHEYILIQKTGHKFRFNHNGIEIDNWFIEREDRTECLIRFIQWKALPICDESIKKAIKEVQWLYD